MRMSLHCWAEREALAEREARGYCPAGVTRMWMLLASGWSLCAL